ncbi:MAG TPA: ABC transporter permease, partial [Paracoccus sp.]|nr:ABC transporter permease [Paracoccus sp. (in: a-proteobacteria)]
MEPLGWLEIIARIGWQLAPVWVALALTFAISLRYRRRLGLYGKLFDSNIGMIGFGIVMFWVFAALFADLIITHDPLVQISRMRNVVPGTPLPDAAGRYEYFLLGGDALARDVFSRAIMGAREVLRIAPLAAMISFMIGITLGLPAGYFAGRLDTALTFLANLVLAFPVILLFFLLVAPEIQNTLIPRVMAGVLFLVPVIFATVLLNARLFTRPARRNLYVGLVLVVGLWAYSGLAFNADPLGVWGMTPNLLNVFVAVVFVNAPTVFRIVRGITLDIKTRDYVSA